MRADSSPLVPLWIDPTHASTFHEHGLRTLDDLFSIRGESRLDKAGLPTWRERLVLDLDSPDGRRTRFYLKRYHRPPMPERRRRFFARLGRCSTAGVERRWIDALLADGISVPRVAAFAEEWSGRREQRSALILEEVPGVSLEKWAATHDGRASRQMIDGLARFVARFHQLGYIHRDLYLSHVFVQESDVDAPQFTMIDLQRVLRQPLRCGRWQLRDLAQLNYSTPDHLAGNRERLRFLRSYLLEWRRLCQDPDLERPPRPRVVLHGSLAGGNLQWIARKTAKIASHDLKRRRRLQSAHASERRPTA